MKIGFYLSVDPSWGGVYQYSLVLLESLLKLKDHELTIFSTVDDIPKSVRNREDVNIIQLNNPKRSIFIKLRDFASLIIASLMPKIVPFMYRHGLFWLITLPDKWSNRSYIKAIDGENLDLIIYPTSLHLSFLAKTPAVVAIHDLQHRLNPQFPEVSSGGRFELREYGFSQMARHAKYILVDSQVGKEDVLSCYPGTDPAKIVILPFLPPSYLDTKISHRSATKLLQKYHIKSPYFYYPAKFWPHKHHLDLLEALRLCHAKGKKYSLVLTGSGGAEFDTLGELKTRAKSHGLSRYVKYLGFVKDESVVSALYKNATALVMPTHFGPTNIPVLEAWTLGTPVIYSSVRGCYEQLGEAGISVDPSNPEDIAQAMQRMAQNPEFAARCVQKGRKRLSLWTKADFINRVTTLIQSVK